MKQLAQSGFVFLGVTVLLVLTLMNTCQLDQVEKRVIDNSKTIEEIAKHGVMTRGSTGAGGGSSATADGGWTMSADEKEALADPNNLLSAPNRGYIRDSNPLYGATLKRKIAQDPRGLNPYIANGADVSEYNYFINDTLAYRMHDDLDKWAPQLAIKVTTPDQGLTYEITLRKGVYWHTPAVDWDEGRYEWLRGDHELTSDDFAFLYDMIQNPQVTGRISALRPYFDEFDRCEVMGKYKFRLYFKKKLYTTLANILDLWPSPRWLYMYDEDGNEFDEATWGLKVNEHWYNQKGIGVGRYSFVTWEPGVKMELERFEGYWGPRPAFDRVVMPVIKDQNAWIRSLQTGEIDLTQVQPEQYRTEVLDLNPGEPILGNEKIKLKQYPTLGYFYFGWNGDSVYFSDKRVRQAMTMALDRQGLVDHVFHGLGKITTGPFAQQSPCYDRNVEPWPYDPVKAAAKLEEAGWTDKDGDGVREKMIDGELVPFEFTLLIYGSSTEYETLANIYREDLLKVGVKLNPRAVEWSTMLKKMDEREFDVYTGAWVLGWETDLMQLWHSQEADKPNSSNRIGFRNADADRVAEALRVTFDPAERVKLCHEFHQIVHEEQPYTFFYQRDRPLLYWDHMNEPETALIHPYRDIRLWSFNEERP